MIQNIIAITIVAAAVAWGIRSVVRIFTNKNDESNCGCGSSSCKSDIQNIRQKTSAKATKKTK